MKDSTATFLRSSPHTQCQLILDGFIYLNSEVDQLAIVIARLNAWLDAVDMMKAEKGQAKSFISTSNTFRDKADSLTEQILLNSEKVKHLSDQIAKALLQNIQNP
jgi:hypothetical protein